MQWEYGGRFIHLFFSGLGSKERGVYSRCPRVYAAPTMWQMMRVGELVAGEEKRKLIDIIFTFFYLVHIYICTFDFSSVVL
jgi:hypothetical protein